MVRPINLERFQSAAARRGVAVDPPPPVEPVNPDDNSVDDRPAVRVLCVLPNASTLINGIKFVKVPAGMLSELIPARVADRLAVITGYSVVQPIRDTAESDRSAELMKEEPDVTARSV